MSNARWLVVLASISALVGWNVPAIAEDGMALASAARVAHDEQASGPPVSDPAEAMALTRRAVRNLRQATLQRDVASWAQEHLLLQQAWVSLDRAVPAFSGAQRQRALQLRADLDAAMRRPSTQLGKFVSPFQEAYDPPPPGHNELALLAKQGQALLRDQTLERPPDTDDVAWAGSGATPARNSVDASGGPQVARAVISNVPGETVAWPQLKLRLGR